MSNEQPPVDDDISEGDRLYEEDQSALFAALTGVMDERGLDEHEIVPLLLDAAYHFRAVGYVVETTKPSEAGLRMDFDRLRKLVDEVHRDYRKNAGNVVRDIVAMLTAIAERMEEEEAAQSVKPTNVLFDGSGR
jgi:hypothetical protein